MIRKVLQSTATTVAWTPVRNAKILFPIADLKLTLFLQKFKTLLKTFSLISAVLIL